MDKRKELRNEYQSRRKIGGVFRITNTVSGSYFLDATADLRAKRNSFDFMVSSGTCFHHKLKKDWDTYGGDSFIFENIEEIEQKEDQSHIEFLDDLQVLKQIWSEKLSAVTRY